MTADSDMLNRMVERAQGDPFFFGWVIHNYLTIHSETQEQLANRLSCSLPQLDNLSLCLLPDEHDERFLEKIQKVAQYVGVAQDILLSIIREVQSLGALREISDLETPQMLKAARDRKTKPDDPSDSDKNGA